MRRTKGGKDLSALQGMRLPWGRLPQAVGLLWPFPLIGGDGQCLPAIPNHHRPRQSLIYGFIKKPSCLTMSGFKFPIKSC